MKNQYTITLSEQEPSQQGNGSKLGFAFTEGTQATIWQEDDGTWSYCLHGIGPTGLYSETDDQIGYDTAAQAERDARDFYAEAQEPGS